MISYRFILLWSAIILTASSGLILTIFKLKPTDGIIVVSGGKTIVAKDINIKELEKSTTAEAAQNLYYYYKFADKDDIKARKWHEEWNRRLK
jgi:hypothetical protein